MAGNSHIEIKGARVHNLKNVDVKIPHGKFTVITGLSGSGKSSLAFDTLYAEGQRRYIESLSSYARQFLGKLDKPETDYIKGIAPAIAIEQKVITSNPRSTVGTSTEIYDYLKVLFARIGKTISPKSGKEVKNHSVTDVVDFVQTLKKGNRFLILSPILHFEDYGVAKQLEILKQQGFVRLFIDEETLSLDDAIAKTPSNIQDAQLIIDRLKVDFSAEEQQSRLADSVQLAFSEGNGECSIYDVDKGVATPFSTRFELDGMEFQVPSEHFFTFNNPFGACKTCEGFGQVIGIDEDIVIPNRNLNIYEGAIAPWNTNSMRKYYRKLVNSAAEFNFPIHRPISKLTKEQYQLLWDGNKHFTGLHEYFDRIKGKMYKIQYRVLLARYRGKTECLDCRGTRLRKDANYVKINKKSITDVVLMPIDKSLVFFKQLELDDYDTQVSKRILPEIVQRLEFLCKVGLGYLTLNRRSNSLSGGESQRINLATSLGSSLVGSMYILDEPTIGLHPKDTEQLVQVIHNLRDLGNTVIIVEHEEDIMRAADEILDIGPKAGAFGGEIVFQGTHKELQKQKSSLTADYLTGKKEIPIPKKRRKSKHQLTFDGVRKHNLNNIQVAVPLHSLVCITGVSGSGKSTLVKDIIYPIVKNKLGLGSGTVSANTKGDWKHIEAVELIDQNPIGKSSRSNPVTYVKAFDEIRKLLSKQQLSKQRNYYPGFFSFNVDGGRCEVCEGEGEITVGMQFMADIHLPCENCNGTRYKNETLEVKFEGKNIADMLEMDISQAIQFFQNSKEHLADKVAKKLLPLEEVGLGYLKMGQASSTLSGGEAQRIKLASFLAKGKKATPTLFIFDEPTTGLHFHDINKLIIAFNRLIDDGHSILVIEHNAEVIKCADWIIDLGPEGGEKGGKIVFEGTPEDIVKSKKSWTGKFLKKCF